jgi:hypothetical protein
MFFLRSAADEILLKCGRRDAECSKCGDPKTAKVRRMDRERGTPAHSVRVVFDNAKARQTVSFSGPVTLVTFGSEQYVWINDGLNSRADPDNPP